MPCRSFDCGIVAAPSPSSRSSSRRAASPASLVDVLPALPSHRLRPVIISCRRPVISSVISDNLLACRPASRFAARLSFRLSSCPSSRFSPRLASRPARSLSRAVRLAVIDCPALLVGWLGAGRDGSRSLSRHCPPALPSLLACSDVGRLRLFRLRRSACSVGGSICVCIVMAKLYI